MPERKFTYYVSRRLDDSSCYSIRGKRRKEIVRTLKEFKAKRIKNPEDEARYIRRTECGSMLWGPITKVTVTYFNLMDLVNRCLGEFRGSWEF